MHIANSTVKTNFCLAVDVLFKSIGQLNNLLVRQKGRRFIYIKLSNAALNSRTSSIKGKLENICVGNHEQGYVETAKVWTCISCNSYIGC